MVPHELSSHHGDEHSFVTLSDFDKFFEAQRTLDMGMIIKIGLNLSEERVPRKFKNFVHINDWLLRPRTIGQLALFELAMVTHNGSFQNCFPKYQALLYQNVHARTSSHEVSEEEKSNGTSSAFNSFVEQSTQQDLCFECGSETNNLEECSSPGA